MNKEEINFKSDIWSFGCIIYEILTEDKLFNGDNQWDIV